MTELRNVLNVSITIGFSWQGTLNIILFWIVLKSLIASNLTNNYKIYLNLKKIILLAKLFTFTNSGRGSQHSQIYYAPNRRSQNPYKR